MDEPVAIITGAGRGIGRAVAETLGHAGYRLVLIARSNQQLSETARQVKQSSITLRADVTDAGEVENAIGVAVEKFDRVDAVIHCAGAAPVRSIAEMSPEEWRLTLETNLSSAFYLCRSVWPVFQRQRGGVVVLISSEAARDPFSGFAAYGAAKAGLNLFARAAAREGEAIGVCVHSIAPSAVETGMFRAILSPEQYPTEKTLAPTDVANVVLQCVRGELRYTTGEVIYLHKVL